MLKAKATPSEYSDRNVPKARRYAGPDPANPAINHVVQGRAVTAPSARCPVCDLEVRTVKGIWVFERRYPDRYRAHRVGRNKEQDWPCPGGGTDVPGTEVLPPVVPPQTPATKVWLVRDVAQGATGLVHRINDDRRTSCGMALIRPHSFTALPTDATCPACT